MDLMQVFAGGAVVGLIAGFWGHIKAGLWRVANLFVQRVEINSEYAHNALVSHLIARYRRSTTYDRMYGAWHEYRRDGRYALVPYETFGHRSLLFWNGWRPFFFRNEVEARAGSQRGGGENAPVAAGTKVHSTLTFLRGTLDVDRLLREACAANDRLTWETEAVETERLRFAIHHVPSRSKEEDAMDGFGSANGLPWYQQSSYRLLGYRSEELGKRPLHEGRALDQLIFPQRIKDLIREVELWRTSRDWYRQRGIPWKRGWLLYGPPGTGKTALARAFAQDLNLPIFVFNLAELNNHELMKSWTEMQKSVPCIALWEDFDNVFHGRENVARRHQLPFLLAAKKEDDDAGPRPGAPLTFDCVLNCLDGVEKSDGIFTIITTNDLGKIDPALGLPRTLPDGAVEFISTRPGRIDKAVELTYMEPADRRALARRILGDSPHELREMLAFVDRYPDLQETPAQFQERCAQLALASFWKEEKARAARLPFAPAPAEWEMAEEPWHPPLVLDRAPA